MYYWAGKDWEICITQGLWTQKNTKRWEIVWIESQGYRENQPILRFLAGPIFYLRKGKETQHFSALMC